MSMDKSLLAGSTTMLVLKLLDGQDMYGYQMIEELASSAAISLDPVILANVLIIGLIVWKSGPPTIKGPDIVLNAAIKVSTVIAKMVGFIVGSTILNKIVLWDAPIFFAASIV